MMQSPAEILLEPPKKVYECEEYMEEQTVQVFALYLKKVDQSKEERKFLIPLCTKTVTKMVTVLS
ncbi:hypothetical protein [Thermaerobacillus caldiproteolyticus]|uniref:hypothetical protein n=1 Tax=Thermaerobacillus caldiproteolyticus TaxID=247480 RepID=UPI00188C0029|nr:hypothetical protein [Anoxybacillus caldiproteolyticus]QPA29942.1 hypothetical protein ISX45_09680 [Anoxybacillus caldiproteolyticus]